MQYIILAHAIVFFQRRKLREALPYNFLVILLCLLCFLLLTCIVNVYLPHYNHSYTVYFTTSSSHVVLPTAHRSASVPSLEKPDVYQDTLNLTGYYCQVVLPWLLLL